MASSGAMQTGWLNLGGTWYYMASSGVMQQNRLVEFRRNVVLYGIKWSNAEPGGNGLAEAVTIFTEMGIWQLIPG